MNKRINIKALFMVVFMMMGFAFAQQFQVPINVTDGTNQINLEVGVDPSGTDARDPIDIVLPPQGPAGTFDAALNITGARLRVDFRSNSLTQKTYTMSYVAATGQGPIVLTWNPAQLAALGTFQIVDNITGSLFTLDMTTVGTLNTSSSPFIAAGLRILVTPSAPAELKADFSADVRTGPAPLTVQFTDESIQGSAAIVSYEWYFGDGAVSFQRNPSHTYNIAAAFDVRLIVTDALGNSDEEVKTAYINPLARPQAQFSATPTTGNAPLAVSFADLSVPGSAAITSRLWDFGDGSTSTLQNPSHTYSQVGVYSVSLAVTDANSLSDTETRSNLISALNGTPALFSINLQVTDGVGNMNLTVGYHEDATENYDFSLDVKAPPRPPQGAFDARVVANASTELSTDYRAITTSSTTNFNIEYQRTTGQSDITISWSPLASGVLDDYNVFLIDGTAQIDMKTQTSVAVSDPSQVTVQVAPGKNVFSFIEVTQYADVVLTNGCSFSATVYIDMRQSQSPDNYLGNFTGTLRYPQHVTVIENSPILSGFTGNIIVNAQTRTITFDGAKAVGQAGLVPIFTVDFAIAGNVGSQFVLDLDYSTLAAAYSFNDLTPKLQVDDLTVTILAPNLLGDVNGDSVDPITGQIRINSKTGRPYVNSTDANIILSYSVGINVGTNNLRRIQAGIGDVNCDGLTNSTDALIILTYDVGLPVSAPLGQQTCGCNQ